MLKTTSILDAPAHQQPKKPRTSEKNDCGRLPKHNQRKQSKIRPDLWQKKLRFLPHNNAPAHTSLLAREFFDQRQHFLSLHIAQIWLRVIFFQK